MPNIIVAGASGPAFQEFLSIASEDSFLGNIEAVAGAREETVDRPVGRTALRAISLDDAIRSAEAPVVVSFLQDEAAVANEHLLAQGRLVITNAGAHRMDPHTALASPYTNPGQIDELFANKYRDEYMLAVGNCTSVIASVPMAPIHERWGIVSAEIETLQGWSGAGLTEPPEIPKDKRGRITDITGDEKDKIESEPNRLLHQSLEGLENIDIRATPKRGLWMRGHQEKITLQLAEPATAKDIKEAWRDMRSPEILWGLSYGANTPKRKPIKVQSNPLVHWEGTKPRLSKIPRPMRVRAHLREVSEDGHTIVFEALGDNLSLGAAGSAAMLLCYAREKGCLR